MISKVSGKVYSLHELGNKLCQCHACELNREYHDMLSSHYDWHDHTASRDTWAAFAFGALLLIIAVLSI